MPGIGLNTFHVLRQINPMMKGLFLASHFPDSEIDTEVKYLPKATQMTVPGFCPKDYGSRISPPPYGFLLVQVI